MAAFDTLPSPASGTLIEGLLATWQDEVLECKRAENSYDTKKLGKHFSALSNEAALRRHGRAGMILSIDDCSRGVVGTRAIDRPAKGRVLKQGVAEHTSTRSTLRDVHKVQHLNGHVLMLEIPPAPRGHPVPWRGHHYGRSGEPPGAAPARQTRRSHVFPLLSDALTSEQKRNKIHNLLAKLRRTGQIANTGSRRNSRWEPL
ncbi:MAG: ATP-binding protein [Brachybacterium sp.]